MTAPWPPVVPIKLSLYNAVLRQGPGELFLIESADGSPLNSHQLDLGQAISGGCAVDKSDPGWQYAEPNELDPEFAEMLADAWQETVEMVAKGITNAS
jgi:hypothetical protein